MEKRKETSIAVDLGDGGEITFNLCGFQVKCLEEEMNDSCLMGTANHTKQCTKLKRTTNPQSGALFMRSTWAKIWLCLEPKKSRMNQNEQHYVAGPWIYGRLAYTPSGTVRFHNSPLGQHSGPDCNFWLRASCSSTIETTFVMFWQLQSHWCIIAGALTATLLVIWP